MTDHRNKAKSSTIRLRDPVPSTEGWLSWFKRQLRTLLETWQEIDINLLQRKSESSQVPIKLTLIKPSFSSLAENTTSNQNNSATLKNTEKVGDYSNAAMATEMNNTEITNVYFIATFFNCQEVRQRKRWWGKKSLLENVKWSRLDRVSFRISWNDTYAHTDFGILHMKLPRLHESTVDYTSKHLWKQTWSLNMGQKVTWQDYNEGPSLNILKEFYS